MSAPCHPPIVGGVAKAKAQSKKQPEPAKQSDSISQQRIDRLVDESASMRERIRLQVTAVDYVSEDTVKLIDQWRKLATFERGALEGRTTSEAADRIEALNTKLEALLEERASAAGGGRLEVPQGPPAKPFPH